MCCYHRCRHLSFIGIKHIQGTLLPQTSRPMCSGVEGSGARSNTGGFGHQIIIERGTDSLLGRLHQTSGVRESRVRRRGHLAKSGGRGACAAACGNAISRRAWGARAEAWASHLPFATDPEGKRIDNSVITPRTRTSGVGVTRQVSGVSGLAASQDHLKGVYGRDNMHRDANSVKT